MIPKCQTQKQEPMNQSRQLPYAHVTTFSRTSLFLERFGAYFEYLLNSTNQSEKPTDLKMIFLIFNNVYFSLLITYTSSTLTDMVEILFSWEKVP